MSTGTNYGYDQPDGRRMDPTKTGSDPVSYNPRGNLQHGPYIEGSQEFNSSPGQNGPGYANQNKAVFVTQPFATTYYVRGNKENVDLKKLKAFFWSLINCCCCCPMLGLMALVFVLSSNASQNRHEFELAKSELKKAKILNIIGTVIGSVTVLSITVIYTLPIPTSSWFSLVLILCGLTCIGLITLCWCNRSPV